MNRFFILLCVNLLFLLSLFVPIRQTGEVKSAIFSRTRISVFIGGNYRFSLFGYTSPLSLVTVEGQSISGQAYSDDSGYFSISGYFYPDATRETCLQAYDQLGRSTAPVCLPPFPAERYVNIGPVIMPPTISFDKNLYYTGDEVVISGQTVPDTNIDLSVYAQKQLLPGLSHGPFNINVNAYSLPELAAKVDSKGNYSIVLPSAGGSKYRIFTTTEFSGNPSPQSIALTLKILPWWMVFVNFLFYLLGLIKPHSLEIIILCQLMVLLYLAYRRYFTFHTISLNRAIVLREKKAIMNVDSK